MYGFKTEHFGLLPVEFFNKRADRADARGKFCRKEHIACLVGDVPVQVCVRETAQIRDLCGLDSCFLETFALCRVFRRFILIDKAAGKREKSFPGIFRAPFKQNAAAAVCNDNADCRGYIVVEIKTAVAAEPFAVINIADVFSAAHRTQRKFVSVHLKHLMVSASARASDRLIVCEISGTRSGIAAFIRDARPFAFPSPPRTSCVLMIADASSISSGMNLKMISMMRTA